MKKNALLIIFICCQWASSLYAANIQKFTYCDGIFKFNIPSAIDAKYIKANTTSASCKYGYPLKLKSKNGNKIVEINIYDGDGNTTDVSIFEKDEYLSKFTSTYPRKLHYILSNKSANGTTTIVTFYWLDNAGIVKKISKEFYFSKENIFYAKASYNINPTDMNDVVFANALEQLFLSAEVDY